jgi:hypothetical protein
VSGRKPLKKIHTHRHLFFFAKQKASLAFFIAFMGVSQQQGKEEKKKKTSKANCRTKNKNKRAAEKNRERRWWGLHTQ